MGCRSLARVARQPSARSTARRRNGPSVCGEDRREVVLVLEGQRSADDGGARPGVAELGREVDDPLRARAQPGRRGHLRVGLQGDAARHRACRADRDRRRRSPACTQASVLARNRGVSRITTMRLTDARQGAPGIGVALPLDGEGVATARQPPRRRRRARPPPRCRPPDGGRTSRPPGGSTARSARAPAPVMSGVACENAHPVRVIDSPRQRRACATTSSAGRQCDAWLSPRTATVVAARGAGQAEGAHAQAPVALGDPARRVGHLLAPPPGSAPRSSAAPGCRHGRRGSCAAAPKHRGGCSSVRRVSCASRSTCAWTSAEPATVTPTTPAVAAAAAASVQRGGRPTSAGAARTGSSTSTLVSHAATDGQPEDGHGRRVAHRVARARTGRRSAAASATGRPSRRCRRGTAAAPRAEHARRRPSPCGHAGAHDRQRAEDRQQRHPAGERQPAR